MPDTRPLLNTEREPSQTRFDMGNKTEGQRKKRVLVVGAGAAGTIQSTLLHQPIVLASS